MLPTRSLRMALAFTLSLAGSPFVNAQICAEWDAVPVPGVRPSASAAAYQFPPPGRVEAAAVWDPDGEGPASPQLIVSGPFVIAGNVLADGWAVFDGAAWKPLSTRPPATGHAHFLTTFEGNLIAGIGQDLFRYDGAWSRIGRATQLATEPTTFRCSAVINGELWIGGAFTAIDSTPADGLAALKATGWSAPDPGVGARSCVQSIIEHDGTALAGGYRVGAYIWNTTAFVRQRREGSWIDLGVWTAPGNSVVNTLLVHGGALLAGGSFGTLWSPPGGAIRRWDGAAWTTIHSGLYADPVGVLIPDAGGLLACSTGGNGEIVNRKYNRAIAHRFNGTQWSIVGSGSRGDVRGAVVFQGRAIAFGEFTGAINHGLAWPDGQIWQGVGDGLAHSARAFTLWQDRLVAVGTAVSVLDGGRWQPLPYNSADYPSFMAAGVADRLYTATSTTVSELYNGLWTRLPTTFGAAQAPYSDPLISGLTDFNNRLHVFGYFRAGSNAPGSGIAAWNGAAWEGLDGGVSNGAATTQVFAAVVHQGRLIVAGDFKRAGPLVTNNAAAWDGTHWSTMGDGIPSRVLDLIEHQGQLYALAAPQVFGRDYLWRWTGNRWMPVGDRSTIGALPRRLASIRGELVMLFSEGGAAVLRNNQWTSMNRSGVYFTSIVEHGGRVFAGVTYRSQIWKRIAPYLAELSATNADIVTTPVATHVRVREGRHFSLSALVGGVSQFETAWTHDGVPVTLGPPTDLSTYSASSEGPNHQTGQGGVTRLGCSSSRRHQAGIYTYTVSNPCSSVSGGPITLEVLCGGDFNEDGVLNWTDISDFLEAWLRQDDRANIDRYAGSSPNDLYLFLSFYFAGCD